MATADLISAQDPRKTTPNNQLVNIAPGTSGGVTPAQPASQTPNADATYDASTIWHGDDRDKGLAEAEAANGMNTLGGLAARSSLLADSYERQRENMAPTAAPQQTAAQAGLVGIDRSDINYDRAQQQQALNNVLAAAQGNAPSAAEMQLRRQADANAANQFGLAAAFGGRSAGGALRTASIGSANVQAQTNQDAAALRANEMATARGQALTGTQGVRAGDQDLATQQAGLAQQTQIQNANLSQQANAQNQNAIIQGLQLDQIQAQNLAQNTLQANNEAIGARGGQQVADTARSAAKYQLLGSAIGGGAQVGAALVSDKREKTNIQKADLSKLADALEGFTFRYSDPKDGAGPRAGVMAQDIQKGGALGKLIVIEQKGQPLRLDVGNSLGVTMALAADAHKRIRRLEGAE